MGTFYELAHLRVELVIGWQQPIGCGGVAVFPNDIVVADQDGAVLIPQALRTVVPPTTNQYLNLIKNSSLAVAVGYPDLVSVTTTALNQSGRVLECIGVMMAVYLTLSLLTAWAMNAFNRSHALKGAA